MKAVLQPGKDVSVGISSTHDWERAVKANIGWGLGIRLDRKIKMTVMFWTQHHVQEPIEQEFRRSVGHTV
jgi:hypothetical protein